MMMLSVEDYECCKKSDTEKCVFVFDLTSTSRMYKAYLYFFDGEKCQIYTYGAL